jgi:hypothetical protein
MAPNLPERFVGLKREIASSYPNFQERVTSAWVDVLEQLEERTNSIIKGGPSVSYLHRVELCSYPEILPISIFPK